MVLDDHGGRKKRIQHEKKNLKVKKEKTIKSCRSAAFKEINRKKTRKNP